MYKSFKFVLFNESFPNPAKSEIQPNFGWSWIMWISAGFVKKAGFRPEMEPEPNSGTALINRSVNCNFSNSVTSVDTKLYRYNLLWPQLSEKTSVNGTTTEHLST